jgi:outer membrane protein assembly factor BamB
MLSTNARHLVLILPLLGALPAVAQSITEDLKLTASDAAAADEFGIAVAISGTTAIVGSWQDDAGGTNSGSAYLFDTATGDQLFKLTASDGAAGDEFGRSVAVSGTTAIVGANGDGSFTGSAYLFNTQTGLQIAKLTASDAAVNDRFGYAVAISGTTAIVGALGTDDNGSSSGSAYLFDTVTGNQLAKLTASDAAGGDFFGWSVAISGSAAIIGAWGDDDSGSNSGSAYIFDTITGNQIAKLTASDAAAGDAFGFSVAISGSMAIVGAWVNDDTGSAYLFDTATGNQVAKLTASDASFGDFFGYAVGFSGSTAIVGAYGNQDAGEFSGSAYLFDTLTGSQLAKLTASDAAGGDAFGISVAISGTTIIVGARLDDDAGADSGSAYLLTVPAINEDFKLVAADASEFSGFGFSVAISGSTAIVGSFSDDDLGPNSGSAYLFDAVTGNQLAKLTATDAGRGDFFGTSVAIWGTTAIVGAREAGEPGFAGTGSAYVFDTVSGNQLFKLNASDAELNDLFGVSVAIYGTTAIVGASWDDDAGPLTGSAYLFDTATGTQLFKLTASDAATGDLFGDRVAISGTTAIVSAFGNDDAGADSGSAYVFDTETGLQIAKLTADDAEAGAAFGSSVSISGNTAIVGAGFDDGTGSAYLFDVVTGSQIAKLTASDAAIDDVFGTSVAISGTKAVVGASSDETFAGSAYVFDVLTGNQIAKLVASDAAVGDFFSDALAISGTKIIVGAAQDDDAGQSSGSAYIFTIETCTADSNGDGVLNFFDLADFIALFNAGDPAADLAAPFGILNFFDLTAYTVLYNAGCP